MKEFLRKIFPTAISEIEEEAIEEYLYGPKEFREMEQKMADEMAARPKSPIPLPEIGERIHLYSIKGHYEVVSIDHKKRTIELTCKRWRYSSQGSRTFPFSDYKCKEGEGRKLEKYTRHT